jgi:hypothetical protein
MPPPDTSLQPVLTRGLLAELGYIHLSKLSSPHDKRERVSVTLMCSFYDPAELDTVTKSTAEKRRGSV